MEKLTERYRPQSLREIVGQPPIRLLRAFASDPYPTCFLLEGQPGTGKTSAAYALAAELGCHDEMSGLDTAIASELHVDAVREWFRRLGLRPMCGRWRVWVIEELEQISPQSQTYLKVALETRLPGHVIVVATSNGAAKLQPALLQRFTTLAFGSGPCFGEASVERLCNVWKAETGLDELPPGWQSWGWSGESFSLRLAIDQMQATLLCRRALAGAV